MMVPRYPSNRWIEAYRTPCVIKLYVRWARRYINDVRVQCLDIVSVEVMPEGKGLFTELLTWIEQTNWPCVLYVENVLSHRFQQFFEKRGYTFAGDNGMGARSYYKRKEIRDGKA
jgi:hypothetical protein